MLSVGSHLVMPFDATDTRFAFVSFRQVENAKMKKQKKKYDFCSNPNFPSVASIQTRARKTRKVSNVFGSFVSLLMRESGICNLNGYNVVDKSP